MFMKITTVLMGVCLSAHALPAAAQGTAQGSPTEQNLDSAGQFRNITSTGVTKPPGAALDTAPDARAPADQKKNRAIDRKIESGICIGCN